MILPAIRGATVGLSSPIRSALTVPEIGPVRLATSKPSECSASAMFSTLVTLVATLASDAAMSTIGARPSPNARSDADFRLEVDRAFLAAERNRQGRPGRLNSSAKSLAPAGSIDAGRGAVHRIAVDVGAVDLTPPAAVAVPATSKLVLPASSGFRLCRQEARELAVALGLDRVALVGELMTARQLRDDLAVDRERADAVPVGERTRARDRQCRPAARRAA